MDLIQCRRLARGVLVLGPAAALLLVLAHCIPVVLVSLVVLLFLLSAGGLTVLVSTEDPQGGSILPSASPPTETRDPPRVVVRVRRVPRPAQQPPTQGGNQAPVQPVIGTAPRATDPMPVPTLEPTSNPDLVEALAAAVDLYTYTYSGPLGGYVIEARGQYVGCLRGTSVASTEASTADYCKRYKVKPQDVVHTEVPHASRDGKSKAYEVTVRQE